MKKLALIVLLAVVASRVLSDRGDHRHPPAPRPSSHMMVIHDDVVSPTAEHARSATGVHIQLSWNKDDDATVATTPPRPPGRTAKQKRRSSVGSVTPAPPRGPQVVPVWFPKSEREEEGLANPDTAGARVLIGQVSVTTERARLDLQNMVNREVVLWLAADVPMTWKAPVRLIDRMVQGSYVQTMTRSFGPKPGEIAVEDSKAEPLVGLDDFYTLYRAGQKLDFSEARRADFVESYRRDVASARMRRSGAVIAVILALLGATSLYVRADEATKGYYTNRLRMLATLGLGAAGAVAYRYYA